MGKSAEKPKIQLTQGPPGLNLPNLNEARRMNAGAPRIAPLVSAAFASTIEPSASATLPVQEDYWPMDFIAQKNRVGTGGEDLLSRNFNWGVPIVSLPGRAGMGLNLGLSLNSLIWTKSGTNIHFDLGKGFPSPGFRLGFPELGTAFYNTETGTGSMLVTMPSGRIYEFRENPALGSNVYEEMSGTRMLLVIKPHFNYLNTIWTLLLTDGTAYKFKIIANNPKCIEIKDRNGNFISVAYTTSERIDTITDTLNRVVKFNYDGSNRLSSITQNWSGATHTYATFAYSNVTIQTNFPGLDLVGASNGTTISVLSRMDMADGKVYAFEYNTYAQVKTIKCFTPNSASPSNFPGDYTLLSSISYDLTPDAGAPQSDCPRFFSRIDWAKDWNSGVLTSFAGDGATWGSVTTPDGMMYKEFFGASGWQRGLTLQTETWSGGSRKKWTTSTWANDNPNVSYWLNPRVVETNVYDENGNQKRTTIDYADFGSVSDIREYDAPPNTSTVLRHTHFDYLRGTAYTGNTKRRLTQLVTSQTVYDGSGALQSKITNEYDLPNQQDQQYLDHQGPPIRHDTMNFGPSFVQGRGNLNVVRRWDVTAPADINKSVASKIGYNTSGSVIFSRDPLNHGTSLSYTDSFSDSVNRNTLAYPTTITDADNHSGIVQYNYDFGAPTRTQNPKDAVVVNTYDPIGRLSRVTNQVNQAYTRYVYAPNHLSVQSFTTVNDLSSEFYQITVFDGHGRTRGVASDHPTSVGGYKARNFEYDIMGRRVRQTNPTEINVGWVPAGDDVAGWVWSSQAYDWQGRLTVSTDQEGNTKEVLYGGCGCAGGQVVVMRDEVGRRQKMTYDILGRLKTTQALFIQPKNQPLNGDGDVYSTQINTYNVRDQITQVSQIAQSGGASQITTRQYDGHGRLWKQRAPIASGDTIYEYYGDDTVFRVTDARQAAATFTYYGRHLIQDITYTAPAGVAATPNVHYAYDENGSRTLMNDGLGTVTYAYDGLSRITSEIRQFTATFGQHQPALPGTYKLTYDYNLTGQVKRVGYESSNHPGDNGYIDYAFDKAGNMTGVTGSPFAGATSYSTEMKYTSWGGLKSLTYGNTLTLMVGYDTRQQLQSFTLKRQNNMSVMEKAYQYHADGRIKFSDNSVHDEFDRAFHYDQVGRLEEAWTGSQARNYINQLPIGTDVVPYHLSYQYDVWGNQLSQFGKYWSSEITAPAATYQNMRRDGWEYDMAGNVTKEGGNLLQYDAAGRNVSILEEQSGLESSQSFDGDGLVVRRDPRTSEPIFYMRSTALGGKVITEINGKRTDITWGIPRGAKLRSHVYSGETRVVTQEMIETDPVTPVTQELIWRQVDPITGTTITPKGDGSFSSVRQEPDPQGIDVGIVDPGGVVGPPIDPEIPTLINMGATGDVSYTLDGMTISAELGRRLIGSEAAVEAPVDDIIVIIRNGQPHLARWQAYADGYQGYVPVGEKYLEGGTLSGHQRPGDTDLASINGATGDEAELGRRSSFGFAFGPQDQRKRRTEDTETAEGTKPGESCVVTLVARKINFDDIPFLGKFDSYMKYYHMFVTTGPRVGEWDWLYHGVAPATGETSLRTQSRSWTTDGPDDNNWDRAAYEKYGGVATHETVPRSCDSIKENFNDTLDGIHKAKITYNMFGTNSNATISTMLDAYDPTLLKRLNHQLWERMPYSAKVTLFPIVGIGTPIPGWGVRLKY